MGRLTFDVPEDVHTKLRVHAATRHMSQQAILLEVLRGVLADTQTRQERLQQRMAEWEKARVGLKLERGERSWHDVIHEGHKW